MNNSVSRKERYTFLQFFVQSFLLEKNNDKMYRMEKRRIKVLKQVLSDVSDHFDGSEEFIQKRREEVWAQKKMSVREVIYFCFND